MQHKELDYYMRIIAADNCAVASLCSYPSALSNGDVYDQMPHNASYVVRAVNCHKQLVDALGKMLIYAENHPFLDKRDVEFAKSALSKAEAS